MKAITKSFIVIILALTISSSLTSLVKAGGPYYINELNPKSNKGSFYKWYGEPASYVTSTACGNGQCYRLIQQTETIYFWTPSLTNVHRIYVYQRTNNPDGACVRYWSTYYRSGMLFLWYLDVNQRNPQNQGMYLEIGHNDYFPNYAANLHMSNDCVPGWWCGGLYVYWDDMKYTTNP